LSRDIPSPSPWPGLTNGSFPDISFSGKKKADVEVNTVKCVDHCDLLNPPPNPRKRTETAGAVFQREHIVMTERGIR
jgi:hypothetical protein